MEFGKIIKTFKSKKGRTVVVRYPRWSDLDVMWRYINELSKEDTFLTVLGKPISRKEEKVFLKWVIDGMKKGNRRHFVVEVDGVYAGNCEITRRTEHRVRHVGVLGISLGKEFRGEGIGRALFHLLFSQGKAMKLRLLQLTCFENNTGALHLYEQLGFQKVGVIPGAIAFRGTYVGEVIMYRQS